MTAEECIERITEVLSRDITITGAGCPQFHIDGTSTTIVYPGGKETMERLIEISDIIREWKRGGKRKMTDLDKKRLESNRKIAALLSELVEKNPSWRFHQILMNFGIENPNEDRWYEESEATLDGLVRFADEAR